ncbi:MAG: hypothetical protein JXX14_06930 [Deltaproteobacteria bacterium]|nr:hypothetical protein [Deltaproteobacteria bacterium]
MTKTRLEQKEALQKLTSLKDIAASIESDLQRVRQTQTEIEIDLQQIATIEGPATVHQIGNNYFYKKRKHQLLCAVIQERQELERLHQLQIEKLNSVKNVLAQATRRLGHLSDRQS